MAGVGGANGPVCRAGMQRWLVLRGGRDACGWAARTGHASPAVCALQSRLIDNTITQILSEVQPGARGCTVTLRRSPPRCHRRGWQPAGANLPVVAPLPLLQHKFQKQSCQSNPVLSNQIRWLLLAVALCSFICHLSSNPVIQSSFSDWLEPKLWSGVPVRQELTSLGLVGRSFKTTMARLGCFVEPRRATRRQSLLHLLPSVTTCF